MANYKIINKKKVFDLSVRVQADKPIKKNAEIYTSYGDRYWLTRRTFEMLSGKQQIELFNEGTRIIQ